MLEWLNIHWEDFNTEYMFITLIVFSLLWIIYFFPRALPKIVYGIYRKEYVGREEKGGVSFVIEPTEPYRKEEHSPVIISKCIHIDIGLEDYMFKRRYRDMRFEKALGLPYWTKVLGSYRTLIISSVEENINSAISVNKENIGYFLGLHEFDINQVEVDFKINSFLHSCYFNHKPILQMVKDMEKWVHRVTEFQDHKIMSIILREYGHLVIKYKGKVVYKYNRCFEIMKVTDRDQ